MLIIYRSQSAKNGLGPMFAEKESWKLGFSECRISGKLGFFRKTVKISRV